ncbi:site-2 protease family protein [Micromonospora sp. 4G55]|uniref:site-2 protease family protein n=1 Tax=Micromonospora sp. 4G55 TaxID=2806102 RepID=UPI001A59E410|nr:site-2 protease family protein [Micromonospora sp. 4G55]MBM0256069.1 site-2 protease family protein [Micromonospora sp. 4G55]
MRMSMLLVSPVMSDPSSDRQLRPVVPPQSAISATSQTATDLHNAVMGGRRTWRAKTAKVGGGAAAVGAATLKVLGKTALIGKLGLFALLKLKTFLSMLISIGAYTIFWGWKFAVGFVVLMFVHELGHVFVLRLQGIKASAPMFIPFIGAFVNVEGEQRSVSQEAASALAGPIAGLLGAGAVLGVAESMNSDFLRALAYTAFFLNLFNLFPVLPLDGGRVAGALHPLIWLAGMAAAVGLIIWQPSPVFFFILILGGLETWRRWRERKSGRAMEYLSVETSVRWQIAAAYVFTIAVCLIGMDAAYIPRPL